jgi:hypothetical protein
MQTLSIGQPVIGQGGERGYIASIAPANGRIFAIGSGGLQPVANDVEVIFETHVTKASDSMVELWASRAASLPHISESEIEQRRASAMATQSDFRRQGELKRAAEDAARAAFMVEAKSRVPADAKAVIIAELIEDQSDSMSDYFGSKTTRTLILGFSTHTRDLFPELRKAALNNVETADLFDAPAKAEHREKYSMGGGFYLKTSYRHSNGWRVSKSRLYRGVESMPVGEWSLAPVASASPQTVVASAGGATISEHVHSKQGFAMFIVSLADRVERDEFDRLLTDAKAARGWYSRAWNGTPAGFAFKDKSAAEAFAAGMAPALEPSTVTPKAERPPAATNSGVAAKLRGLADAMQGDIDHKFADRLTNTPKRMREAGSARIDGYRLQRTQQALRALADHHDAGTVPAELATIRTKAQVFDLARADLDCSGGYYDAPRETGKPALTTPPALALWAMIGDASAAQRTADELRAKIERLQFANIPGYFPTPAPIVARMIEAARLPERGLILEPSAGSGAILDQVREAAPGCELAAFERHSSLREILTAKGYTLVGADFMESCLPRDFDRVLMNPPFENGQDIEHVRHAFAQLAPGGRLVAIMSPGPFFRSDRKATEFRQWFEDHGGEREDMPAGAFKESGTGIATVMVTIDRD